MNIENTIIINYNSRLSPFLSFNTKKDPLIEKPAAHPVDPARLRVTCTRKRSGISSATRNDPDIRQRDAGAFHG